MQPEEDLVPSLGSPADSDIPTVESEAEPGAIPRRTHSAYPALVCCWI